MIEELRDRVARHCRQPVTFTHVPRLTLSRADCGSGPRVAVYEPLICVVVQGRKRVFVGGQTLEYDPATYLLATMDLPAASVVIDGPCLGCVVTLDLAVLTQLTMDLPTAGTADDPAAADDRLGGAASPPAMTVQSLDDDLLDPLLRLVRLLDQPQDVSVLAPLIERELLYRLLKGPAGTSLRQLAFPDSRLTRIARAVHAIRRSYATPLSAEQLARVAGMSVTSFHRHFRALTAMSPLQYQKQIRLQEARRLLLTQTPTLQPPRMPWVTRAPRSSAANTAGSSARRRRTIAIKSDHPADRATDFPFDSVAGTPVGENKVGRRSLPVLPLAGSRINVHRSAKLQAARSSSTDRRPHMLSSRS